ncbi:MAG: hypothetical protein GDA66_06340 [Nitrospira sp. CR1.2]|nr:hypothetical protein [Nitrospira sp. CR1.2]
MRQGVMAFSLMVVVVMMQGCATQGKPSTPGAVAGAQMSQASSSNEEFVQKMEQHVERQDRPGSTLMFR